MKEKNTTIAINQDEIASYLKDIRKIKVMTPEREKELAKRMLSNDLGLIEKESIKKELLEGNLRFVITVSKQYQNQGLELCDLISEGNYGLLRAIETFDWTKNLRFISYAVWWVRQSILQSLNENSRTIRFPVNVVQEFHKAKKEQDVTGEELPDKFVNLPYTVNLDSPLNEDGDTLLDVIVNPNEDRPEDVFSTKDILRQKLASILNILDEREKVIILGRWRILGMILTLQKRGFVK